MLVLTRKKGERILIGDDIVVTLIDIRGDGVRIGFDAPRGVPIQRAEVVTAVTDANTEAAATSAATGEVLVGLLRGARQVPAAPAGDGTPAPETGAPGPPAVDVAPTPAPAPPASAERRPVPKPGPRLSP